jgi:hypothetical protein
MRTTLPLLLAALSAACATTQSLQLAAPASAIRAAEEHGAMAFPEASLHLTLAREGMAAAVALNEQGEEEQAESLLLRAEADAELAVALSRVEAERAEAQAAIARVRKLQAENPYAPTVPE